jgi:ubiquinone/menaquinone biosynthesis C-methylase UbiE
MSGIRNGSSYSRSFSNRRRGPCWRTFREFPARVLDLGCGQGNTTRCLADALEPSECIGVEYDAALVDYAQTRPGNPPSVRFQQGDATQLPFPDASFDVAFCRYLLIHIADPLRVVREMMRVVRPGGFVVAYEGDFSAERTSHPACAALETIHRVCRGLFQNPPAGRRRVHYLRETMTIGNIRAVLAVRITPVLGRCSPLPPSTARMRLLSASMVGRMVEDRTGK